MYLSDPEYNNFFETLSSLKQDFESDGMVFVDITEESEQDITEEIAALVDNSFEHNRDRLLCQKILNSRGRKDDEIIDSRFASWEDRDLNLLIDYSLKKIEENARYIEALRNSFRINISSWENPFEFEEWMIERCGFYQIGFNIRKSQAQCDEYNRQYYIYEVDLLPVETILP